MSKHITLEEVNAIVNNKEYDDSLRYVVKLAFMTGLRINEIVKLINQTRYIIKEHKGTQEPIIEFKGKGMVNIQQKITLTIQDIVKRINNDWSSAGSLSKSIQRWNTKYDLNLELHSIRRLAATIIDDNLDIRHAQSLLNHKSTETTQIYIDKHNAYKKKHYAQDTLKEILLTGRNELVTLESLKRENQELKRRLSKYE